VAARGLDLAKLNAFLILRLRCSRLGSRGEEGGTENWFAVVIVVFAGFYNGAAATQRDYRPLDEMTYVRVGVPGPDPDKRQSVPPGEVDPLVKWILSIREQFGERAK